MYQSFYKLTGKPFRLSPDPGFFFPSRGHKRALAYLRYGLNQDEGFVVITGAPGTGKTTLAKILLQELGDKNLVVAHLTTTQLEADDMLRMVAASFGIRYEGLEKSALLKSLEQFLLARARERKRALLVIDEAQNLPERSLEELRMLSNLQVGDKALVQTFLLGQAQFRQMLDHPDMEQLRQRVIANYHLSPLAADECQRYIESRLQHVNWKNDPTIAEVAYERIHEYTEGIPRRINMLCDRVMLYACMEEMHDITGEVVALVIRELEQEVSGDYVEPASSDRIPLPSMFPVEPESIKAPSGEPDTTSSPADNKTTQPQTHTLKPPLKTEKPAKPAFGQAAKKTTIPPKQKTPADHVEKLSEKLKAEAAKWQKEKTVSTRDSSEDAEKTDSHVMGNTVTRHKPAPFQSGEDQTFTQSGIDERDLFRVIPGGKSGAQQNPPAEQSAQGRPLAPAAQAQPSQEDVVLRRILRLVLAFHRSPSRFPGLDNANQPLPDGITELLELAISDDQVLTRVSPAAVMGISPMMLRAAVRFFVRRAFFVVDSDDYRVLGLQSGSSQSLVERHYDLLMRLLRQDKQRGSADSVERIGQAYEALGRLDQAVQSRQQPRERRPVVEETEDESDATDDGLTIDFEQVTTRPDTRARISSAFGKKPHEVINLDAAVSRKRIRYVGQLAVLGFGALVIVLGMYIVQLEPSVDGQDQDVQVQQSDQMANIDTISEARRAPLSFSDGTDDAVVQIETGRQAPTLSRVDEFGAGDDLPDERSTNTGLAGDAMETEAVGSSSPGTKLPDKKTVAASRGKKEAFFDRDTFPGASVDTVFSDNTLAEKDTTKAVQFDTMNKPESKSRVAVVDEESTPVKIPDVVRTDKQTLAVVPQQYPGVDVEIASGSAPADIAVKQTPGSAVVPEVPRSNAVVLSETRQQTTNGVNENTGAGNVTIINPSLGAVTGSALQGGQLTASTETAPATITTPVRSAIPEKDLNDIIGQFVDAYQKGDIGKVMSLFAANARTNNRTTSDGIRADYADLFKSSVSREMDITSLFWESDNIHARGVGEYRARVKAADTARAQTFIGKVTVQLTRHGDKLEMTRFYFSNQKVIAEPDVVVAKPAPAVAAKTVSREEIQALLSNFVRFYADGNLDGLVALFAENARTNDQTTRAGVEKDHADLFDNTNYRQMTIKGMQWEFVNATATGSGSFEVVIRAKGSEILNTYTGTIEIQVQRLANKGLIITKMIHNTQ